MIRRTISVSATLLLGLAAFVVLATPASAIPTTGWATWTPITGSSNNYATTMQLPARGFPQAMVATDSRANVQLASGDSTFLSTSTEVGAKYGSSKGNAYLLLRPKADNATDPSTTTYTFNHPTPNTGWAFVLGDIDADKVQISAKSADGTPLTATQINQWKTGHNAFNYAGGTDLPTWDPATSTLSGNAAAADTNGASAWFEPDVSISSLTFVFTRRAGFPVYQTWFASVARTISGTVTDVSAAGGSCPIDQTTVQLTGPDGEDLASTKPVNGAYSFGQYATQAGYVVSILPPAGCAVVANQQHTVSTAAADATADFTLRQIIPQAVSGTVRTTAGDPVAGVQITLTPPAGPTKVITTDALGNYLFDDNAEQSGYTVAVTAVPAGFHTDAASSHIFDIPIGAAVTAQDFTLSELPTVSGRITGGGDPLGAVTVTLTPSGGGTPVTTETKGDGTYTFEHVPADTYDITVTPPAGYRSPPPRNNVTVGTADKTGQDFALTRPGALGGQVIDSATATAAADATITVRGPDGDQRVPVEADGSYFLDGLTSGTYEITVTAPAGYLAVGPSTRTVVITDRGEIRGGQDFTIRTAPPTSTAPPRPTQTATTNPVVPQASAGPVLADTGPRDVGAELLLAVALLGLGLGLTVAARKRHG